MQAVLAVLLAAAAAEVKQKVEEAVVVAGAEVDGAASPATSVMFIRP